MKNIFLFILVIALYCTQDIFSQTMNVDYDKFKVEDNLHVFSWLTLMPDGKTVLLPCVQSEPCIIYDLENREVQKEYDVGNWYAGARVDLSKSGKYMLLQQTHFVDFSPNKDREVDFEIIDVASGSEILKLNGYHSVKFSHDEKYAVALTSEKVTFWNLGSGLTEKSFKLEGAANSIAISPDGKYIAVTHHPTEKEIKQLFPVYQDKKQKKKLKNILKYKNLVNVFDGNTFEKLYTVKEMYDIIFRLTYSEDGSYLLVYNVPHSNMATSRSGKQSFINIIDGKTGEPERWIIPTFATFEPDFKLSPDNKYFGVTTQAKFPEIHIYSMESQKLLKRFELSYRILQNIREGDAASDGRVAFEFLPGGEELLFTFGNHLVVWNMEIQ